MGNQNAQKKGEKFNVLNTRFVENIIEFSEK